MTPEVVGTQGYGDCLGRAVQVSQFSIHSFRNSNHSSVLVVAIIDTTQASFTSSPNAPHPFRSVLNPPHRTHTDSSQITNILLRYIPLCHRLSYMPYLGVAYLRYIVVVQFQSDNFAAALAVERTMLSSFNLRIAYPLFSAVVWTVRE